MAQFILTYHGGSRPASEEEGKAHMERYMAWIGGLDAITPQQPLKNTQMLGDAPEGHVPMMGFTIINAADIGAAREIAKACPFLEMDNAAMQVSEFHQMGGQT